MAMGINKGRNRIIAMSDNSMSMRRFTVLYMSLGLATNGHKWFHK
jgi:hypothetical protein